MEWRVWPGEWYLDAGALLIAFVLDMVFRELPGAIHPVVWIGKVISRIERVGALLRGPVPAFAWGVLMAALPCASRILTVLECCHIRHSIHQ